LRKLLALLVVGAILGGAFAYVYRTEPGWYVRIRYPLRYEAIVRGHARNYDLDPAFVAAVIYQESKFNAHARSSSGAIGLMQLLPATARGIAVHTGGSRFRVSDLDDPRSTSATAPGTCATFWTNTATSAPRWPLTTRGRTTSTAGAQTGWGSPSARRATTSKGSST
jgi:hypothetical protein